MRVLITGATGLVGCRLCEELLRSGHQITVVTRSKKKYDSVVGLPAVVLEHDLTQKLLSSPILESIEAVVHLAGENIAGSRWSKEFKKKLYDSRVLTTQNLLESFIQLKQRSLSVVISASGIDIYPPSDQQCNEETVTEDSSFLSRLCHQWEDLVYEKTKQLNIRCLQARFGVVLARNSRVLSEMEGFARLGCLGPISGQDFWMSFIHIEDLVKGLIFCLENSKMSGPVNFTSPKPCLHSDFVSALNQTFERRNFLSSPKTLLSIMKGEMINAVTKSHRIVPQKLTDHNFTFCFENIKSVLENLYKGFLWPLRFETQQWIPKDKNVVFDFFSSVKNLEKITPPWLKFEWIASPPSKIQQGSEIDYKICIYGVNIKTRTKIVSYNPPKLLVDEKLKGPFRRWRHTHYFQSLAEGTLVTDHVNYELPYKLNLLGGSFAQSDIKKIFDYRKHKVLDLLNIKE